MVIIVKFRIAIVIVTCLASLLLLFLLNHFFVYTFVVFVFVFLVYYLFTNCDCAFSVKNV